MQSRKAKNKKTFIYANEIITDDREEDGSNVKCFRLKADLTSSHTQSNSDKPYRFTTHLCNLNGRVVLWSCAIRQAFTWS